MGCCQCDGVAMGSHKAAVLVDLPPHMLDYYRSSGKTAVSVDRCILPEVQDLWAAGIRTTGCCCGHGVEVASICVDEDDISRMNELGYKRHDLGPDMYHGIFRSKTIQEQPNDPHN